jgi:PAS domain S-box-containing protein
MATAVANDLIQLTLVGEALEAGPVAVFVADDDGRYLAVNAFACELLGYGRQELLDLRVTDVAVNQGAVEDFDEMQRRGSHTGLTTLRRKDGKELPMHFRASATKVGGMALWVGVCWPAAD